MTQKLETLLMQIVITVFCFNLSKNFLIEKTSFSDVLSLNLDKRKVNRGKSISWKDNEINLALHCVFCSVYMTPLKK